jgi:hypothetical protein
MLALVDNTLTRIEPALDVQGGFSVRVGKPDIKGKGRVYVYAGSEIVQSGVRFFVMDGKDDITLNKLTGEFQVKARGKGVIRAIFAGRHEDVEIKR